MAFSQHSPAVSSRAAYTPVVVFVLLSLVFSKPLYEWARLSLASSLHSHILLIPFISAYLVWNRLPLLPAKQGNGLLPAGVLGVCALSLCGAGLLAAGEMLPQDRSAIFIAGYVCGVAAWGFAFFGVPVMRALAFPMGFLVFMIPMPFGLEQILEQLLQRLSADASHLFFLIGGETFMRQGQMFMLPGLTIEVAQECSGIRSSIVLFITAVLAANMILHSGWRRITLVLAVIPLGILRNGMRIYLISVLTVHVDPGIIDSALHHRGGPIFFGMSLVPFLALLWLLRKGDKRVTNRPSDQLTQ